MKKTPTFPENQEKYLFSAKTLRIMKLSLFLFLFSIIQLWASNSYSQRTKLSLNLKDVTVEEALNKIEEKSEFYFLYSPRMIDVNRKVTVALKKDDIYDALVQIFANTNVDYVVSDRQIVLSTREQIGLLKTGIAKTVQQAVTIKGTVTDESGNPLPGVTIYVKGTTQGTITDSEGKYAITVPPNATLVFSFVGMKEQDIPVAGKTTIDVVMQQEVLSLDEVVTIGYGTTIKKDLTGAVSTVKTSDMENLPFSNPMKALQGRVAGLSVVNNSGKPGAGNTITIRGIQSIRGTNSPIYVVDGVIMSSINGLNQDDFESVSVLKDASAAAIYGARAANGVILVTTKRGKKGRAPTLTYNGYFGWQATNNLQPKLLNGLQWINLYREAFETAGLVESQFPSEEFIEQNYGYRWDPNAPNGQGTGSYVPLDNAVNSDWYAALTRTGNVQRHDLSISGGSENSNYYFSTSYYNNKGMVLSTGYKKFNITFNSDHRIGKLFDFGNSLMISSSRTDGNNVNYALFMAKVPITRIYEDDGSWGVIRNTTMEHMHPNPVWRAQACVPDYSKGTSVRGNVYLTLHILKDLDFTARGNISKSFGNVVAFTAATNPAWNWEGSTINSIHKSRNESQWWSTDLLLNYEHNFNDVHRIKLMAGYSAEENVYESLSGGREGTPNNDIPYLGAGDPNTQTNDDSYNDWAFISQFARLYYSFKDKYLITGTMRRDGSSRLAEGHRYGIFPSISAAWRVSNEGFMQGVEFINDLKVRASYGSLGNVLSLSTYGTVATLNQVKLVMNQAPFAGYTLMRAINSDLKWEVTDKLDIGVDGTLLHNSLYFTFDYFREITHDLLFSLALPYTTGYGSTFPYVSGSPTINAGEVRNTGIEMMLGWRKTTGNWHFDVSTNLTHVKNEVVDLAGQNLETQGLKEGYPVRSFYGYTSDGLILDEEQKTGQWKGKDIGDIHIVDMDGDTVITPKDRGIIGRRYPKFYYGVIGKVSYKGFSFQLQLNGVQGVDKYVANHAYNYFYSWAKNDVADLLNRYHPTRNPNGTLPRLDKKDKGKNDQTSTFWLRDASYLRIQTISFSYSFRNMLKEVSAVKDLSLYLSAENLYTFTKFPLAEVDTRKDPLIGVPLPRTVILGIKATF